MAPTFGRRVRPAADDWVDGRQAEPFVVRANYRLEQDGSLVEQLQELQSELTRLLGVEATDEPVELYLFRDEASYGRYLTSRFPGVPARRAMYVKHTGPGMVFAYQSRDLAIDLRHESTHALLHAVLSSVPLWLDEGLAEYFELPREQRAFDNAYAASLVWRIRLGQVQSLAALEQKRELAEMGRAEYRDAWAWVHFMLHGPEAARDELRKYLCDLEKSDSAEPLSRRLERRIPGLEKQLLVHFKTWQRPK